jgi:hypothetical protein
MIIMKNNQKGFIVLMLIAVIAILLIGGGTYILVQQKKITQLMNSENSDSVGVAKEIDKKVPDTSLEKSITKIEKPVIESLRQYDSEELNVIHSDVNIKVTVAGKNFPICKKIDTCDLVFFIGEKSFSPLSLNNAFTFDFLPTKMKNGIYESYVYNMATGIKSNSMNVSVINSVSGVIQPIFPHGGETLKPGQHVLIQWKNNPLTTQFYPNGFPAVNVQIVAGTLEQCGEYTNNGSMGTCRGYEIYSGPNTGSFDWVVPNEYPSSGEFLVRIWPDIGMETARHISEKGFDVSGYSGRFTITK